MSDDPFEFPTSFPIKAMGRDTPVFRQVVIDLIAAHRLRQAFRRVAGIDQFHAGSDAQFDVRMVGGKPM